MAVRRPFVPNHGRLKRLPAGDTLPVVLPTLSSARFQLWAESDQTQSFSGTGVLAAPWNQYVGETSAAPPGSPALFNFTSNGRPVRVFGSLCYALSGNMPLRVLLFNTVTGQATELSGFSNLTANTTTWVTMLQRIGANFFTRGASTYRLAFSIWQGASQTNSYGVTIKGRTESFLYLEELYSQ
jgi:hypothetical protein